MRALLVCTVLVIGLAVGTVLVGANRGSQSTARDHVAWVAEALKRMQTIEPGATRKELLVVFT
jgi:hypothetical protein